MSVLLGNKLPSVDWESRIGGQMIPVCDAIQIVLDNTPRLDTESVPLAEAMGRILAEDIAADSDLPPFDRAQMDGYAVRAADTQNGGARLRVVGESAAGNG